MEQLGDALHGGRRAVCVCALLCGLLGVLSPSVVPYAPAASGSSDSPTTQHNADAHHLAIVVSEAPAVSSVVTDPSDSGAPRLLDALSPTSLIPTLIGFASLVVQLLRYRVERQRAAEQQRSADELRARMEEMAAAHAQELADVRASVLAATTRAPPPPPRRRALPKAALKAVPKAAWPSGPFMR